MHPAMRLLCCAIGLLLATAVEAQDVWLPRECSRSEEPSELDSPLAQSHSSFLIPNFSFNHHYSHLLGLNTMVGTAPSNTTGTSRYNEEASEAHGQTLPAVLTPHGQTLWTPQTRRTEEKCVAPYYYNDTLFHGIRASHWIVGGCTQDYGSFTLTLGRDLPLRHEDEQSHPHYYSLRLPEEDLLLELTALSHSAILRLSRQVPVHLEVNSDEHQGRQWTDSLRQVLFAENPVHRIYQGWGEPAGFSGYIAVYYGQAPTYYIGTSFTSAEAAYANLLSETDSLRLSFEEMQAQCASQWMGRFHTLCVEDPDSALVLRFYGALYRASFLPREISDCDGSYPRFADGRPTQPPHSRLSSLVSPLKRYGDFSLWDIYRAQLPLLTLIDPLRSGDMMQSLVGMYEEGGWLPIFPCWNSYTAAMIGDHTCVALADAYVKGVRHFDALTAYRAMRQNAFTTPRRRKDYQDGLGRRAMTSYLRYGYIPLEDSVPDAFHQQEQTSRTLEYAFDDYAVAQMALALSQNEQDASAADQKTWQEDYEQLMQRSANWKKVFNPLTRYVDGRHADGSWLHNDHPYDRLPFITEGAPAHYTFYVPHDLPALVAAMGGEKAFEERLDTLFHGGYYWHGNEPCHHIAYLYNLCGRPDKTREQVARILQTEYNDTPGGLSGNDDAGQMSAWLLFSSLGFYPVCPASPDYQLGLPAFRKVTLHLQNGHTFTILRSEQPTGTWTLNGQPLPSFSLSHSDIQQGGVISY